MDVLEYFLPLLIIIMCFTYSTWWYLSNRWWKSSSVPTNWPLVGMLPGLIRNVHRVHEFATDVLVETKGTFEFHGPVLANLNMLATSDPANIHHILSKNFSNYPKGVEFRKIFDILGNGIFNVDYELWEIHRKTTMSLMSHAKFQTFLERNLWDIIENGLRPILDTFAEQDTLFDLQDIFQRFTFDAISKLLLDYDPKSLSIDLPHVPCEKAFNDVMDALMYRHILPEGCWKLQKWLRIGKEKQLIQAWEAFDQFLYPCISRKQEELMQKSTIKDEEFTFLNAYIKMYNQWKDGDLGTLQTFLRDTFLNLMLAGRDTTSAALTWFFWLLAKNPLVEKRIREEIQQQLHLKEDENLKCFNGEETRKLVYLHSALCETLRFFPSVAIEHKLPLEFDILPSGHHVSPNTRVVLLFYTMGRMESIWGKDCLEFKPERWISERGGIKHEPSYKFPAFNAGPRTCIGKEMAFIQMKIVAATIIYNYHIQLGEDQIISPNSSIIIQMKHGLKVRLVKRVPLMSNA
ncbi:alkane hydroxylase MAH1-like isoform X1 [Solanum stenotomum]|uniref:alkane hydroxylase MAH1-like isoform X1 n=1 Tax=Solanum stenotomum TaxID=172797 RepID=UPI0020D0B94A|nr:alkane hydroxylase MAH1-like isoform X1 [Solanum stenotomum]